MGIQPTNLSAEVSRNLHLINFFLLPRSFLPGAFPFQRFNSTLSLRSVTQILGVLPQIVSQVA